MDIINRTVIKKYEYAQVNLLTDSNNNQFIEKIQFHNPPVISLTFIYDFNELEGYISILDPLEIPHVRIIDGSQNEKCTTFVMDFINGIDCAREPKAEYLFMAAKKIGAVYAKSKMNMERLDKKIRDKYTLSKEKILEYVKVISKSYNMPRMDFLIDYIYEKYQYRTVFATHGDMQFKNFIYNNELHLIDWGVRISPFFSDLYTLIAQADRVGADTDEIKKRYCESSQIGSICDEDIFIGGIIGCIQAVFELLVFDCPIEWTDNSYNELQYLIQKLDFR